MTISVKLFATLRKYLPPDAINKTATIDLDNNATTDSIIKRMNIPDDNVHLILIDGKHVTKGSNLHDGAVVSFFPPIAGGQD
ncbi:MAG: MoaD/ThiS family protein [Gemmatimonadota bacterium]|nr:MoaD/ThiS family protein [Gemmatimonadota bacterium]